MPPSKPVSTQFLAQFEQEAYHACSEWPLYLMVRQRQLEAALSTPQGKPPHGPQTHSRG